MRSGQLRKRARQAPEVRTTDALDGVTQPVPTSRRRDREAFLCQFQDKRCDEERHQGTDFCATHIDTMRDRANRAAEYERQIEAQKDSLLRVMNQ